MDKFKIGLLVLGFGYFVYLFCPGANQAGRYSFRHATGSSVTVLDTANANVYYVSGNIGNDWTKINPRTGKSSKVEITEEGE